MRGDGSTSFGRGIFSVLSHESLPRPLTNDWDVAEGGKDRKDRGHPLRQDRNWRMNETPRLSLFSSVTSVPPYFDDF